LGVIVLSKHSIIANQASPGETDRAVFGKANARNRRSHSALHFDEAGLTARREATSFSTSSYVNWLFGSSIVNFLINFPSGP
jgi:hypothetical protein